MAKRDVVFVNGSTTSLRFSYRYSSTAIKAEHLKDLDPGSSFTHKFRDDGTFEKIEVDYLISSEVSTHFKPTNLKISTETMSECSMIKVIDCEVSGEVVGTARKFRLDTVARAPTPEAGWIASTVRWIASMVRRKDVPAQDIPR